MSESFIVAVRIRPPSAAEAATPQHRSIIQPVAADTLVFDPPAELSDWTDPAAAAAAAASRRLTAHPNALPSASRHKDIHYGFDHVFPSTATQAQVYEATAGRLVERVLDGYNATVFAYGATGAGKTHTMIGTAAQPGVMVQTMHDLFAGMRQRDAGSKYEVGVSYMEVYNEQIRDLLSPSPTASPLQLREERDGSMTIAGLSSHTPSSAAEVFRMLERGNLRRTQSATEANAQSSRSHAILQVTLRRREVEAGKTASRVRVAKLSLIDLAGSERAAVSKNRGQTLKEGANINRSLLALGNCINQLAARSKHSAGAEMAADTHKHQPRTPRRAHNSRGKENKQPLAAAAAANIHASATAAVVSSFVPYRDSKLTRLLKDSLGGNCLTVMIANVSPSALSSEDSHNTLKYANRAKDIEVRVAKNERSVGWHVSQYEERMKELSEENARLAARCERAERAAVQREGGTDVSDETVRRKEEWVARLLACVAARQSVEQLVSSTKSSLVKLNATVVLQQDEMECWQRIAQLSSASPVSASLSQQLSSQHKQRVALLSKLQQHTGELAALSASLSELTAAMRADLPASLHGAVNACTQHALDVIALRESKGMVDSYSNMVSEYRQRLMAHNNNIVTLVHALQTAYQLLSDGDKAAQQALYQRALDQVDALPVSPRLYDTLTDSERSVLSALAVERVGAEHVGATAAATSAERPVEEQAVHEEVNFQYASLDAQHRRTATQSIAHPTLGAVGVSASSSRPTVTTPAAEGRVSVWTGKAFDYGRSASLASTGGALSSLAGTMQPMALAEQQARTSAGDGTTKALSPVATVKLAPVRPSVSFAPSTFHPRSPSVVSSLSAILSPHSQTAASASPQPKGTVRAPALTTGASSFSSHFAQLMHSPPPTHTSKLAPLPSIDSPPKEANSRLQHDSAAAQPHYSSRQYVALPATPTSHLRLTSNPPAYTSIPSAFFHAPSQPVATPGRSHTRLGSGGTPLKPAVASVVASLPFAVHGDRGGEQEEERKADDKEQKAASSGSSPSQARLAAATATPTFSKRSYAAVASFSPATGFASPAPSPPTLPAVTPSPRPSPRLSSATSTVPFSQRLFRPSLSVSSGIPRLTPNKGKRPLERGSQPMYGRLLPSNNSPSSLPVYKKALTRW